MEDEVSFSSKYFLVASINQSGTLNQGDYWAVVKDLNSGNWLPCNDKVVVTIAQHSLNNTTSCILFYKKNLSIVIVVKGGFVFLNIVFGCGDPTYYPSPGRGIEFAFSIFRNLHLSKTLVFMKSIGRGLPNLG